MVKTVPYAHALKVQGRAGFHDRSYVGVGEIPLLGEMSRSDKGVMA